MDQWRASEKNSAGAPGGRAEDEVGGGERRADPRLQVGVAARPGLGNDLAWTDGEDAGGFGGLGSEGVAREVDIILWCRNRIERTNTK